MSVLTKYQFCAIFLTCSQSAFAPSWLTEDYRAAWAGHHCLRMAEDGGDPVAAWPENLKMNLSENMPTLSTQSV